jgi:Zn-finger nucleic acid-binding protein
MPSKRLPVIKDGKLVKKKLTGKLVLRGTCPACGTHLTLSQAEILNAKDVCPDCGAWFAVGLPELEKVQALHDVAVQAKEPKQRHRDKHDAEHRPSKILQVLYKEVHAARPWIESSPAIEHQWFGNRAMTKPTSELMNYDHSDLIDSVITKVAVVASFMCPVVLFILATRLSDETLFEPLKVPLDVTWNIVSQLLPFLNWLGKSVVILLACESFIWILVYQIRYTLGVFPSLIRPVFLALRAVLVAATLAATAAPMWGVYLIFTHDDGPIWGGAGILLFIALVFINLHPSGRD